MRWRIPVFAVLLMSSMTLLAGCGGGGNTASKGLEAARRPSPSRTSFSEREKEERVRKGLEAAAAGKYEDVVSLLAPMFEAGVALSPEACEALGRAWLNLADFSRAERVLAAGLAADPYSTAIRKTLADLNYVKGRLALEEGRYKEASSSFRKAVRVCPGDDKMVCNIGALYRRMGREALADGDAAKAAAILKGSMEVPGVTSENHLLLARALLAKGDAASAMTHVSMYLQLEPGDLRALSLKASICAAIGRRDEALSIWRSVLEKDPGCIEAREGIRRLVAGGGPGGVLIEADAAFREGRLDDAERLYRQALKLELPSSVAAGIHRKLASISMQRNDYMTAIESYRRAEALSPGDIETGLGLARAYMLSKRYDEARELMERLVSRHPDNAQARVELGRFFVKNRLYDNAMPHLQSVVESPESTGAALVDAYDLLGVCHLKKHEPAMAVACWEKVLELDPSNAEACFKLGSLYQYSMQFSRSIDYFEKAVRLVSPGEPACSKYMYWLALAFRQSGQLEMYERTLKELVDSAPVTDPYRRKAVEFLFNPSEKIAALEKKLAGLDSGGREWIEASLELASVMFDSGRIEDASRVLDEVEEAGGCDREQKARTALLRGRIRMAAGDVFGAAVALVKAAGLCRGAPSLSALCSRIRYHLGVLWERMGLRDRALEEYRVALELSRSGGKQCGASFRREIEYRLGKLEIKAGEIRDGMIRLERVVNAAPDTFLASAALKVIRSNEKALLPAPGGGDGRRPAGDGAARRLGSALLEQLRKLMEAFERAGLDEEARAWLKYALTRGAEDDVDFLLAASSFYFRRKEYGSALRMAERAYRKAPGLAEVNRQLGKIYYYTGKKDEAMDCFSRALGLMPDDVESLFALVDIYREKGRGAEARKLLLRVVGSPRFSLETRKQAEQLLKALGG